MHHADLQHYMEKTEEEEEATELGAEIKEHEVEMKIRDEKKNKEEIDDENDNIPATSAATTNLLFFLSPLARTFSVIAKHFCLELIYCILCKFVCNHQFASCSSLNNRGHFQGSQKIKTLVLVSSLVKQEPPPLVEEYYSI